MKCITYGRMKVLTLLIMVISMPLIFLTGGFIAPLVGIAMFGISVWWFISEFNDCNDGFVGKWGRVRQPDKAKKEKKESEDNI